MVAVGKTLEERRCFSDERFDRLRESLGGAARICADKACVYATGSFGRREASAHSDIDLFIVSLNDEKNKSNGSLLSKLDEILVKSELIRAAQQLEFPPFSQDGRFLQHHTAKKVIESTGNQFDDAENTFTARLLLLLESRPLVGEEVHRRVIDDVIAKYWREFSDNYDRFMPAFLANDTLRYWRTLCLNYEASTVPLNPAEAAPNNRAKRKIKNYKLKHSRMLTCYSALLQLLSLYSANKTVTVADVQKMVRLTPTEQVQFVGSKFATNEISTLIAEFLGKYDQFLEVTNASEEELIERFLDPGVSKRLRNLLKNTLQQLIRAPKW
jgi:hypothetical protein